jgi:periplasmic protein TonB
MRAVFLLTLLFVGYGVFAQETRPEVAPPQLSDTAIFDVLEVEASVNRDAWIAHLTKELQPIINKAAKKGMKPGKYVVNVRFLVEKDGSISYVEALNDPGKGLGKGAAQVVKSGPRWKPGEQNGKKVRSFHTQPITFVFTES